MAQRLSAARARLLRKHLAEQIAFGQPGLISSAAREFRVSRQTVHRVIQQMVLAGEVTARGRTRARKYELMILERFERTFELAGLDESEVWRHHLASMFSRPRTTAMELANYAFTEMLNNAVDHSEGTSVKVVAERTAESVRVSVVDDGVGVFRKIQTALGLDDPRHAILELAKGRFTTDPARHTGWGVFFSSRACEIFAMFANGLVFSHLDSGDDFLSDQVDPGSGTSVVMIFDLSSTMTISSLQKKYETQGAGAFSRTIVPVKLASFGSERLVSRSQAKQVLTRIDRFKEVVWDFAKVDTVGQAFADEIFRVFQIAHPECRFTVINANEDVAAMISAAVRILDQK